MKNYYFLITCTSFVFLNLSFSPVSALEKTVNTNIGDGIPNRSAQSGCVTYKINPKRLYAPFKVQVLSKNVIRKFQFEDVSDEVFDKTAQDKNVLADSTVSVNYIDRNGRVVQGETESGHSSRNTGNCGEEITLNFGLKATAGSFERVVNTFSARTYYDAIDPSPPNGIGKKTTLNGWMRENGFFAVKTPTKVEGDDPPLDIEVPEPSNARVKQKSRKAVRPQSAQVNASVRAQAELQGTEDDAFAKYFNHGDLGFGRDMHMKRSGKNNKNIAFYVTNYRSLEDAINREDPIATVAMEYSYGSKTGKNKERYIQFYAFGATGDRIESADLDGRGEKDLPALCVTCHGGDLSNGVGRVGDIGARFLPFDLNAFDYSESDSAYTRAAQEAAFKSMNLALLDAIPTEAMTQLIRGWYTDIRVSNTPATRSETSMNQSKFSKKAQAKVPQGASIAAQSGVTSEIQAQSASTSPLNRPTQNSAHVPAGWRGEHSELYTEIVAPYCRGCHVTREATLDFSTYADFVSYGGSNNDVIKERVCEDGAETDDGNRLTYTMPNAKATYQNMWLSSVDPIDFFTRHGVFTLRENDECGQGPWARP